MMNQCTIQFNNDIDSLLSQSQIPETLDVTSAQTANNRIVRNEDTTRRPQNRNLSSTGRRSPLLPPDFRPTPYTVIVGRGKETRDNPGNKWLEAVARTYLDQYSKATNDKKLKTNIVSEIVSLFVDTYGGGFVKRATNNSCDSSNTMWYNVDNTAAREKVGYVFRDLLSDKYRSSSKSKFLASRRRKERQIQDRVLIQHGQIILSSAEETSTPRDQRRDTMANPKHKIATAKRNNKINSDESKPKLTASSSFLEWKEELEHHSYCPNMNPSPFLQKTVFDEITLPLDYKNDFETLPISPPILIEEEAERFFNMFSGTNRKQGAPSCWTETQRLRLRDDDDEVDYDELMKISLLSFDQFEIEGL